MSKFNIQEAIDKSVHAHLKKNVLPKDIPDFCKMKQGKLSKQSMQKLSTKPFDEASLEEYDQKDNLKINLLQRRDIKMIMIKILPLIRKRRRRIESKRILKTVHDVEINVGESIKDDVVDVEDPTQADASVPKRDKLTWFKKVVVERPESPDPEWHKELTIDDAS
uniref:Uncharacterized protein n=1 Tax=Tanacetum cinerariifolium TaxID=118510 RepID=A0A6L2K5H8_TANCI|nr:hypothetical protein [Tanacetum cinerariifolium]